MQGFHCRACGEFHSEFPLAFGPDEPDAWHRTPPEQLTEDDQLTSDLCVLKGQCFIRGCLDLPIQGHSDPFRWLVWIKVSEKDMLRMVELWETVGRETEPPSEGHLDTSLQLYPETIGLPARIHTQPIGERPQVVVTTTTHPLHEEQTKGLRWDEVQRRVEQLMH